MGYYTEKNAPISLDLVSDAITQTNVPEEYKEKILAYLRAKNVLSRKEIIMLELIMIIQRMSGMSKSRKLEFGLTIGEFQHYDSVVRR